MSLSGKLMISRSFFAVLRGQRKKAWVCCGQTVAFGGNYEADLLWIFKGTIEGIRPITFPQAPVSRCCSACQACAGLSGVSTACCKELGPQL